jgi:hypothetical protein
VPLQAVKTFVYIWTGRLESDITDTKKDIHKVKVNTRNDFHDELGLMIQGEAHMTKTQIDTTRRGPEAKIVEFEAQAERGRETGNVAGAAKPPKFDGTATWWCSGSSSKP